MLAPHSRQFASDEPERSFRGDRHERLAAAALAARLAGPQPSRAHHRESDAGRGMHRISNAVDQRRGVRIKVERNGANHPVVFDEGAEGTPMRMVRNKLAVHGALVEHP